MNNITDDKMPMAGHLGELRKRIIISCAAILIASFAGFYISPNIFNMLKSPIIKLLPEGTTFITLSPLEGWLVYFKIGIAAGLIFSAPVWLFQIWLFVSPAIKAKKHIIAATIVSIIFTAAGMAFGFYVIFPIGLKYFISILSGSGVALMPQMNSYIDFVISFFLAFGLLGLAPIFLFLLIQMGIVSAEQLRKKRPYIIIGAFVVGAIITPPDVFTQIAVAVPLIILFEVTFLFSRLLKSR